MLALKIPWWVTPLMFYMNELQKAQLLALARASIEYGLEQDEMMPLDLDQYPEPFKESGASFVTLQKEGELRGCVGTLEAYQALVLDINEHAYGAAFCDPRFPNLVTDELALLHIEISLLSPPTAIEFSSKIDLLDQLVPLRDGLTIEDQGHKATFLPQVWENLTEPADFLMHLLLKAGLGHKPISPTLKAFRYSVTSFEEDNPN